MRNTNDCYADKGAHPADADWMEYLYHESPQARRAELEAHLAGCGLCREKMNQWNQARSSLDQWRLEFPTQRIRPGFAQFSRWAAAAAILVLMGYAIGRFSVPASNWDAVRAGIEKSLRRELANDFKKEVQQQIQHELGALLAAAQNPGVGSPLGEQLRNVIDVSLQAASAEQEANTREWLGAQEAKRIETAELYAEALRRLAAKQAADFARVHKELETVAVLTETGLKRNQEQMVELASLNQNQQVENFSTDPKSGKP